ncbi:MAG: hypothetical protein KAV87_21620 [Desulfobacteraceae bacterium]|nr:hypothetical protein [Desulfobacteraceae bacterium]
MCSKKMSFCPILFHSGRICFFLNKQRLESQLASNLLTGKFAKGNTIKIDTDTYGFTLAYNTGFPAYFIRLNPSAPCIAGI